MYVPNISLTTGNHLHTDHYTKLNITHIFAINFAYKI